SDLNSCGKSVAYFRSMRKRIAQPRGRDGILRPIVNGPSLGCTPLQEGRLTIGRRMPSCPTSVIESSAMVNHLPRRDFIRQGAARSEEHTSELQSREISYAVFCLKKKKNLINLK